MYFYCVLLNKNNTNNIIIYRVDILDFYDSRKLMRILIRPIVYL